MVTSYMKTVHVALELIPCCFKIVSLFNLFLRLPTSTKPIVDIFSIVNNFQHWFIQPNFLSTVPNTSKNSVHYTFAHRSIIINVKIIIYAFTQFFTDEFSLKLKKYLIFRYSKLFVEQGRDKTLIYLRFRE